VINLFGDYSHNFSKVLFTEWSNQERDVGLMAHMGERRSAYTALVEKPEGRTSPGRLGLTGRIALNE